MPQDITDTVSAQALAEARVRWGLDAAPTAASLRIRQEAVGSDAAKRKGARIAKAAGTPLDVVRALLAIPIPAEWEREVREISHKSDSHSWLMLAWKEPLFQPDRRRLVLYECLPDPLISDEYRMILQDKPYWELPQEQRAGRAAICSAFQWEMYRRHRVKATPFWCIQGKDGGTPISYSEIERRWLRAMKQPDSPPALGALPYAPWDNRVREAVQKRDRLRKFGGSIAEMRKRGNTDYLRVETDAAEREYRKQFFKWFSDTMQEQADVWRWYTSHAEVTHRIPQQSRAEWLAACEAEERFIETGRVPDASEYVTR